MAAPNRTIHALLGFLTWQPMSGYDIKKSVDASISNFWSESYGQIYPMLRKLVDDGLATADDAAPTSGRTRRVYAITRAGRQAVRRWLREPDPPSVLRLEILLKLFFGSQAGAATNLRRVEAHRELQRERIEKYRAITRELRAENSDHPDLPYWLMTVRYGEKQARAAIDWCDETIAKLKALSADGSGGSPR
jgi:DNA-binding PadR family transcriptional regulator